MNRYSGKRFLYLHRFESFCWTSMEVIAKELYPKCFLESLYFLSKGWNSSLSETENTPMQVYRGEKQRM